MTTAAMHELFLDENALWRAVLDRDPAADGLFFFGVKTTGIYCRPACPARRPRRENVAFFRSTADAEHAGLRACLRCRPARSVPERLALCQTVLAAVEAAPANRWRDDELAARGFDPVRVRRAFQAQFGTTFHAHWRELRVMRAREHVRDGRSLSDAGARAGFESESGVRSAFRAVLDATPREAPERATIRVTKLASPLGQLTAAATADGVCLLEFDAGQRGSGARADDSLRRVARRLGGATVAGTNAHLRQLRTELEAWFGGTRRSFDVPLVHAGTDFEIQVWRALAAIPYGETRSYGELARALGRPGASRAVGRANALNPIAILVPCHRVIATSGALTGYAAGLDRKRWLLEHERSAQPGAAAAPSGS